MLARLKHVPRRVWVAIGGLAGCGLIVGLIFQAIQTFGSPTPDAIQVSNATIQARSATIQAEQLKVQQTIAAILANPVQTGPSATANAAQVAQLRLTADALQATQRPLEATLTAIAQRTPGPIGAGAPSTATPEAALANCPQRINFGQAVRCVIDSPTKTDVYTFEAQYDDRVFIRTTRISETLQPWIRVFGPDKAQVCESSGDRVVDISDCSLRRSGAYVIQISDASPNRKEIGGYTLFLQRLNQPGSSSPITFGQTLAGTISREAEMDTYTFNASAEDKILMRMVRISESLQPWIRVYGLEGAQICESYHERLADITTCAIPRSGLYTMLVSDASSGRREKGGYIVYIQRLNAPVNAKPIVASQPLIGNINSIAKLDTYTFEGKATENVVIKMNRTSEIIQPWLRLFDGRGELVCERHDQTQAEVNCTLRAGGTYTLIVGDGSSARRELGNYSLSLTRR